jgi:hypothetical protein
MFAIRRGEVGMPGIWEIVSQLVDLSPHCNERTPDQF